MSTDVIGLFDSLDLANKAGDNLEAAGFSASLIKVQSYDAGVVDEDDYTQGLSHGQSLVAVTTNDNVGEDKAIHILRTSGATKINEITERYHGSATLADSK